MQTHFSFDGQHCLRDYGLIYIETGGAPASPPVTRNTYEIAGVSGTVALDEDPIYATITFRGELFFWKDPPDRAAAQKAIRRVTRWLLCGRKKLIFDHEPDVYYLAEVNQTMDWTYDAWIEGGLGIQFTAQPYAYNTRENSVSVTSADTDMALTLTVDTGEPAPLVMLIKNTGTAPVTAVEITAGEQAMILRGMELAAGDTLTISAEPPISAVFASGDNALPYATQFDALEASAGSNDISVAIAYGTGDPEVKVTAKARGRFV